MTTNEITSTDGMAAGVERGGRKTVTTIPEFVWELSLGIWLTVKGFNPSAAILSEPGSPDLNERDKDRDKNTLAKA
jgi:hypothetical protein